MKHTLLTIENDELLKIVTQNVLRANPLIKIGEPLKSPVAKVWGGKLVDPNAHYCPSAPIVCLDYRPDIKPYEPPPSVMVSVGSVKINFNDTDFDAFKKYGACYLHPYMVNIPHKDWLTAQNPGDVVSVTDPNTFDYAPLTLTQQHFDDHSYVVFRFAVSDN